MKSRPSQGPRISVVMPVFQGQATLDRAIQSLLGQHFTGWELLALDDGSTDGSFEALVAWGRREPRIRVHRSEENRGPSAARNEGLRRAAGATVTYLDCDDEYDPAYLDLVARFADKGDVLVFGYDSVEDEGGPEPHVRAWDPTPFRDLMFLTNLATPLGVAHRRDLALKLGGFDERLWLQEDWDLWKRMARAGAEFLFLPYRSGTYHVRPGSLSERPRLADVQRRALRTTRRAGRPLDRVATERPPSRPPVQSILLASSRPLADSLDDKGTLRTLRNAGFDCRLFAVAGPPGSGTAELAQRLTDQEVPHRTREVVLGPLAAQILEARLDGVPLAAVPAGPDPHDTRAFQALYEAHLEAYRPDALLLSGGDPVRDPFAKVLVDQARRRDIPVVCDLRDHPPVDPEHYFDVDYCLVGTESARRVYWERLRLTCHLLPPPLDPARVHASRRDPRYLTTFLPNTPQGTFTLARVASALARLRPDIPVLVVGDPAQLHRPGPPGQDLAWPSRIHVMDPSRPPRDAYAVTKLLLAPVPPSPDWDPALCGALANGIPVVAGNLGPYPELVADAGLLLDLPLLDLRTPAIPHPSDPFLLWAESIARLWDDDAVSEEFAARARRQARRWDPEHLTPLYAEFFRAICPQPGPPLIPINDC